MVGGCGQTVKRYTLSYQPGFTTSTSGSWTQFWQVNYNTPFQIDSGLNNVFEQALTSHFFVGANHSSLRAGRDTISSG